MIKEIHPVTIMFGISAILAIVAIGFVGLNMVIYALMDDTQVVEAVASEAPEPTLITKNER